MAKLAIVGSGLIKPDLSDFIDACDVVVRFNECKNYRQNSGSKVDILCITNSGAPAIKITEGSLILESDYYNQVSEIWFPRNFVVHKNHAEIHAPTFPQSELEDLSHEIIDANKLADRQIYRFSYDFNVRVFSTVSKAANAPFTMPSTGYFALEHVLTEPRFSKYMKYMIGFGFKGWDGHPWTAERKLALSYNSQRDDFTFVWNGLKRMFSQWRHGLKNRWFDKTRSHRR